MAKVKLSNLGKIQLKRLRDDIVLNSLFILDYRNRYGLEPHTVCNFFDGYMDYLADLEKEKYGKELDNINDFFNEFDTIDNLWEYYCMVEW